MNRLKRIVTLLLVGLAIQAASVQIAHAQDEEATITFVMRDEAGNEISRSTIPADEAANTSLATFFAEISAAIREIIAGNSQTARVQISSTISVEVTGSGMLVANGIAQQATTEEELAAARKKVVQSNPNGFVPGAGSPN